MIYADYDYYVAEFHGTNLSEEEFLQYSKKASNFIDALTLGRSKKTLKSEIRASISDACCGISEVMKINDNGGGIVSESNDGVSVTYASASENKSAEDRLNDAAKMYLRGTGLMCRWC